MSEQTPINGSIEILTPDGQSIGLIVKAATPADVPVILRTVYGLSDVADTPPGQRKGRPPKGEWKGRNNRGQEVTALLWEEVEVTDTEIGRSMAAALLASRTEGQG